MRISRPSLPIRGHFTLWLVLLLLAVRAVVPVGFMPSVDALRDGRFDMVICAGNGGMRTIVVDANGDLVHDDTRGQHGDGQDDQSLHLEQCPFSAMGAAIALPSLAPSVSGVVVLASLQVPALRYASLPPMPAQGPPLGSRAPPLILG